jgi:membrane-bound lytic murein transglycosylase MltF
MTVDAIYLKIVGIAHLSVYNCVKEAFPILEEEGMDKLQIQNLLKEIIKNQLDYPSMDSFIEECSSGIAY